MAETPLIQIFTSLYLNPEDPSLPIRHTLCCLRLVTTLPSTESDRRTMSPKLVNSAAYELVRCEEENARLKEEIQRLRARIRQLRAQSAGVARHQAVHWQRLSSRTAA